MVSSPVQVVRRFDVFQSGKEASERVYHRRPMAIPVGTRIGHVHLKVADLERALGFYCGVLGFELMLRFGTQAAFVSAGGYHHHIGLNTWESRGGTPPPPGTTGLYHVAILYPTRADLGHAVKGLIRHGIKLDGASDHGVSEALYLRDPDENGVELYWNRPRERWPVAADGGIAMYTRALDLEGLLRAADDLVDAPPRVGEGPEDLA
jgi:catechol 2,3-dioxygenase